MAHILPRDDVVAAIKNVLCVSIDEAIETALFKDPFIVEEHWAKHPLAAVLVPDEIFKRTHFERKLDARFRRIWERLAVAAAQVTLGHAEFRRELTGRVNAERLRRIQQILNELEHGQQGHERRRPDWDSELAFVLEGRSKQSISVTVICDVYAEAVRKGKRYAFELKAPMPNSDQTKVSKEKLLKLYSMESPQVDEAYYALPYNPFGSRAKYAWPHPGRWFNMKEDPVVLIGDEFWEKVGGLGTYQAFIAAVNEIAPQYKERIYREYLGIQPPPSALSAKL